MPLADIDAEWMRTILFNDTNPEFEAKGVLDVNAKLLTGGAYDEAPGRDLS